jgi:GTPase SAR1 and related small G proteins
MNRYHSNKFTGQYKATIGADFVSKQLILPTNGSGTGSSAQTVTLTIWDTAGQERFQSLGKAFYRGSDVCVLVYDVTDRMSFDGLQKWKDEFDSCLNGGSVNAAVPGGGGMMQNRLQNGTVIGDKLKFVVVANKADKDYQSWSVTREEGMHFAKSISSEFFECSAKTGLNVEQAFVSAAKAGMDYNMRKQLSMNASMMMQGSQGGMRGYMPPQRIVDLNRGQSSMSDEGDCC